MKPNKTLALAFLIAVCWLVPADANAGAAEAEGENQESQPESIVDLDLRSLSLEELMQIEINPGGTGGFAVQLRELDTDLYLHAYTAAWYRTNDLNRGRDFNTFSLQYFNVMLGANIHEKVVSEILLEYEHGGNELGIRYGLVDYKLDDRLILRAGKFLMPMGKFNEYLYPEYINKLNDRPYCLWQVVPSVWAEIGAQLRGNVEFGDEQSVNYAIYMVNGLEQSANDDGTVGEGGSIRGMRNNFRDYNDGDKAFGGRIGIKPVEQIEVGGSYYDGAYSIDGEHRLSIVDFDAEFSTDRITARGEYVRAVQGTSSGDLVKDGFYAELAYRVTRLLEPVFRFDQADLGEGMETVQRSTFGVVLYPVPDLKSRFNIKFNQSIIHNDGTGSTDNEFVVQWALAF